MKIIRISLAALIIIVLCTLAMLYALLYQSQAPTEGRVVAAGLKHEIDIHFDAYQRPFVQAQNLEDAVYAQGYLHASHRLWQMETLRRAGKGRLAELLGEDALATDIELWRLGIPGIANTLEQNASPRFTALADAYVKGVNAAIRQFRVLPPEFLLLQQQVEPWTASDIYAIGAMTAYQSAGNLKNELLRLALLGTIDPAQFSVFVDDNSERDDYPFVLPEPHTSAGAVTTASHADRVPAADTLSVLERLDATDANQNPYIPRLSFGSNGWVVAPQKSATGKALSALDSHAALGLPNLYYELHLFFGQGRQLRGWSVPGLPGVINGFNEHMAWGFTNIGDTQDLFLERICDDSGRSYRDGDICRPAVVETIEIPVRGRDQPERLQLLHSHNGPMISEEPPISLAWTAHQIGDRGLDALLELNLARSPDQITAALDHWAAPSLNATWADIDGNIGFRSAGLLPLRGAGEGLFPLRGDNPAYRWQGFVAAKDMPQQRNPDSGYLAAANARVNPGASYPLLSADNASPYRMQRLRDVLGQDREFSVDDMRALQLDWHDGQAQQLLPHLLPFLDRQPLSLAAVQALELLQAWQNEPLNNPESAAALIFQAWYPQIAHSVFESSLGTDLFQQLLKHGYLLNNALDTLILSSRHDDAWPEMRSMFKGAVLAEALENTVSELQATLGPEPREWRLDQLQSVQLEHELAKAIPDLALLFSAQPQPWGGSTATLGRARYSYQTPFRVSTAATVRAVAEMDGVPKVASVIPGGQSGHPLSPHYKDQFAAWLQGKLLPIAASPAAAGADRLTLVPGTTDSPGREEDRP
jgi:penicillin amidase